MGFNSGLKGLMRCDLALSLSLSLSLSLPVRTYSPRYDLHLDSPSWLTLSVTQKHEPEAGRSGVVPLCKQDGCIIPGI